MTPDEDVTTGDGAGDGPDVIFVDHNACDQHGRSDSSASASRRAAQLRRSRGVMTAKMDSAARLRNETLRARLSCGTQRLRHSGVVKITIFLYSHSRRRRVRTQDEREERLHGALRSSERPARGAGAPDRDRRGDAAGVAAEPVARQVAFLGSAIASVVTGLTAAHVLRTGSAVHGVLFVHRASGFSLALYDRRAVGVVPPGPRPSWPFRSRSSASDTSAIRTFSRRSVVLGAAFNVLLGAVELVFAAGDAITFLFAWELMTLATAALVATEHEERASRRAAVSLPGHVARGDRLSDRRVPDAGVDVRARCRSRRCCRATSRSGRMRDVLFALFFLGFGVKAGIIPLHVWLPEAHPAAPTQHLRADVRRAHQDRHLRHRAGLRVRPRRAAAVLGRARRRRWGRVGGARRAVRADAARSQAPPRVSQHREHRDHPPRPRRRDDGARLRARRRRRRSASRPASITC